MPVSMSRRLRWGEIDQMVSAGRFRHVRDHLAPTRGFDFRLETSAFHPDPAQAVLVARERLALPAKLDEDDVVSLSITRAELSWYGETPYGELRFEVETEQESPFPFTPTPRDDDGVDFPRALRTAIKSLDPCAVHADEILESDRWWYFPTRQIGTFGVVVDRKSGRAEVFGSGNGGGYEAIMWAYEQGLMDEPLPRVRIDEVRDRARVVSALSRFTGVREVDVGRALDALPATFRGREDKLGVANLYRVLDSMTFAILRD